MPSPPSNGAGLVHRYRLHYFFPRPFEDVCRTSASLYSLILVVMLAACLIRRRAL